MTSTPQRRLAADLRRRGLAAPARLLADAHRPIAPLVADLGAAVGPLLGSAGLPEVRRLLENPAALDALVDELDAGGDTEEPDGRAG